MYKTSSEYKLHKSGAYKFKRLTSGGAFFGEFRIYASGAKVYFAARLPSEQVMIKQGAWALDVALDGWLKMLGVEFIGVAVSKRPSRNIEPHNVGIYYLMRTDDYYRYRRKERWNFSGHTGAKGKRGSSQYLIDPMFMRELNVLTEKERLAWLLGVPT
ncbi:hypothetical protein [Castellaniella sp.]|uniref:hypothetical protein n=1 Tax=Castellaniella sp. TaxID=1955812 RepID=UPI002B001034|nr:hypothetical protein [Castellaniella sp.]